MSNYWKDRFIQSQNNFTDKSVQEINKQLKKYYRELIRYSMKEFENTYLHLLNTVGAGKQPTPADLYKLDKYWRLQAELTEKLKKFGDKEINLLTAKFIEEYRGIYENLAIKDTVGFHEVDDALAKQMINSVWCADGKSWSERIWQNTERLKQALNQSLVDCVVAGRSVEDLTQMLQAQFGVDYRRANTLVRTEMAHIQTAATQQRYKDSGIKQYQVWADEDERRCDVCGQLHKKIYSVYENAPVPVHPNCRCCIIPIVEKHK